MSTDERETHRICIDRRLTSEIVAKARLAALDDDGGQEHPPMEIGVETWKLWKPRTELRVGFFAGDATVIDRVFAKAKEWEAVVSIRFKRVDDVSRAHIRVSFDLNDGSWSYVGRECLGIAKDQPTMNFGWLHAHTDETEYSRTVLHEFGHALGCIHEHQVPGTGVPWNEPKVLKYYMGPPNNWSEADVRSNILDKYSKDQVNATAFDPHSIMLYAIPKSLLLTGDGFPSNSQLSAQDQAFMRAIYP